jgi:hypothetical protein
MKLRGMISKIPVVGGAIAKTLGWEQTMFGDLMGGGSDSAAGTLTRPYGKSAWVRSAIGFVAGPISMRPIVITRDRRGGDVIVDDAALTQFWERPAKTAAGAMNRQELMEATVVLLKLKGQCFWIMDDSWLMPRMKKNPLILARHDSMHAVMEGRELIGWIWTDASGRQNQLIPDQVIHHKFWNPYHEVLGLAEWESAMIAAESDYAAGVFARNLARNNGDRGPYVVGKSGQFSDEQITQITAQLRQKRELGRRGEFRAAFLPGDVDVKEPSVAAVDSEFVVQRLENRKEVYMAFCVPPSFADPQASYSIGSASDRFRLIEDSCMPLAAKIADGMEVVSAKFLATSETIFVEFDWDSHSTMQQVRAERFKTATEAVDRGMPWQTASAYFGLKLPRFAGDSVGRVPFNLTEIETADSPGDNNSPDAAPEDDDLEKLFAQRSTHSCTPPAATMRSDKNAATWRRVRRAREPWEKRYESKVNRYLMDARAETLRKIAAASKAEMEGKAVGKALNVLDLIFNLDAWLGKWTSGLRDLSANALDTAGFEVWTEELDRDDPLTMPAAETLQALAIRENKLKGAGEKVWEKVRLDIEAAIERGETMEEIANRVKITFTGISKSRARTIAATEITVAYEVGRDIAFRAAGVQYTMWVSSGDGRERDSHLRADNQIREIGQEFDVGAYQLMFPGDPAGPPEEVINCRCVRVAVKAPDEPDDDELY